MEYSPLEQSAESYSPTIQKSDPLQPQEARALPIGRLHGTQESRPTPRHVAIIMDGNRRWAERHRLPVGAGHLQGSEVLLPIVQAAAEEGVRHLTVYAFSTENWRRSAEEVGNLFTIMADCVQQYRDQMVAMGVRLHTIGEVERLPPQLVRVLREGEEATRAGERIDLHVALNYGGRREIVRAVQRIAQHVEAGVLTPDAIDEVLFSQFLDTSSLPDPEMVLRTGGEARISNFLLWQSAYAEYVTTPILWPDLTPQDFSSILQEYRERDRRFGR